MSNEVITVCPHCQHVTEKEDVGYQHGKGFFRKAPNGADIMLNMEGIDTCPFCTKEYAYKLIRKVMCVTSKVYWVEPALYVENAPEKADEPAA